MIGRTLGHYRVLERIGSGGMGVVYRARDERLERDVAVKVLPPSSLDNASARKRLLREARSAGSLNHPGICTIYEVGESGDQVWIAMELVEGQPLSEVVKPAGLPIPSVLNAGVQIAEALEIAHKRGVVHRDLKCANVMILPDGRIKILDFGLARRMTVGETQPTLSLPLTNTGAIVGTPQYMPPEVLNGAPGDARSDLWALGVMLFEMVSGSLPFAGRTAFETAAAILHSAPAPFAAAVPVGLRSVIQRCLEKDPARRFQSAGELRAALVALTGPQRAPSGAHDREPPRLHPVRPRPWNAAPSVRLASIAAAFAAVALLFAFDVAGVRSRWFDGRGHAELLSLAVLPLENLSRDTTQDFFADGMTEELITELTKIGALRVIAATSVQGFRGTRAPAVEIARRLHVGAVVLGSVMRSGDQVRVTARLVEMPGERQLWADSYERGLRDVLGLQGEVALAIAHGIQARVTPGEARRVARTARVDPIAYQDCLKGRYYLKRYTAPDLEKAQNFFNDAIARDPAYAPAYAGIAERYYSASSVSMTPHDAMPKAKSAALKALEIDSTLAEAHAILAVVKAGYDHDWLGAERGFHHAIALNPGSVLAHQFFSYCLSNLGRADEAVAESRTAAALDPLSTLTGSMLGQALLSARRYEEATRQLEETIAIDSSDFLPHIYLGMTLLHRGQIARGIAEFETGTRFDDNPVGLAQKGWGYARAGRRRDAMAVLDTLERRGKLPGAFYPDYDVACIQVALGDREAAFRSLLRASEEKSEPVLWAGWDPRMDPLRGDARFTALLKRLGLAHT